MSLPPLGQLPKLKHLTIKGMFGVKNMGFGFYNDVQTSEVPFPSLETLCFKDMPEWEVWSNFRGGEEVGLLFPCLREFTISGCQKLVRIPLIRLPSLSHLVLEKCYGVVLKGFLDVTLLCTLEIKSVTRLSCLHQEFLQNCRALESLYIGYYTKLTRLWANGFKPESLICLKKLDVWHCPQLVTFGEEEQGLPCNLECLTLMSCDNLEKLPSVVEEDQGFPCNLEHLTLIDCSILEKLPNGINNLVSLRRLFVQRCPKLVAVGEQQQGLPPNLEVLTLKDCDDLEKLPNGMSSLMSLKRLHISRCSKLVSFPRSAVPPMLKTLYIESCGALKALPDYGADISHLEVLVIKHCSSLMNANLLTPRTLQKLEVRNCPNLESKWMELQQRDNAIFMSSLISKPMQNFANLGWLHISYCDGLESFPERGWPATPKLRHLEIMMCNNFKSLPFNKFSRNLASLEFLRILRCPKLLSFPGGDLPPNLTTLRIQRCGELLKPLPQWGLHRLTSLCIFRIDGSGHPGMVSLSDDHNQPLLPPAVAELWIEELPNLESLSKGLQNLASLEDLRIYDCPKLRSLPEGEVLSNLSSLTIFGCPILKQQCLPKDKGYYWPIIAGIPKVQIDHSSID